MTRASPLLEPKVILSYQARMAQAMKGEFVGGARVAARFMKGLRAVKGVGEQGGCQENLLRLSPVDQ